MRKLIYYGQQGEAVSLLQYLLSILSEFYLTILFLTIDGIRRRDLGRSQGPPAGCRPGADRCGQ